MAYVHCADVAQIQLQPEQRTAEKSRGGRMSRKAIGCWRGEPYRGEEGETQQNPTGELRRCVSSLAFLFKDAINSRDKILAVHVKQDPFCLRAASSVRWRQVNRLAFCRHLDLYLSETVRLLRVVCLHRPAPMAGPLHLTPECNLLSQQKASSASLQQRCHRITRIKNRSTTNCATDARRVEVIVSSAQGPRQKRTELHGKTERTEIYYPLLQVADEKRRSILLLFFISCFSVLYTSINVYSFDKLVWTVSAVLCFWVDWTCSGKSTDRPLSLWRPRFGKWPKNSAHNGDIHSRSIKWESTAMDPCGRIYGPLSLSCCICPLLDSSSAPECF